MSIKATATLASILCAVLVGYIAGAKIEKAKSTEALQAQIEAGEMLKKGLAAERKSRAEKIAKVEEEEYADPIFVPNCLGPQRLRRIDSVH